MSEPGTGPDGVGYGRLPMVDSLQANAEGGWLATRLDSRNEGWLAGSLTGWMADWLDGWLAGWMDGRALGTVHHQRNEVKCDSSICLRPVQFKTQGTIAVSGCWATATLATPTKVQALCLQTWCCVSSHFHTVSSKTKAAIMTVMSG